MNVSLSIAIKNSIILALVILIAHFLLKSPKDGDDSGAASPLNLERPTSKKNETATESEAETPKGDDLYSYVYGGRKQGGALEAAPGPTPGACHAATSGDAVPQSPLDQGCGNLMAYEGAGALDSWCML